MESLPVELFRDILHHVIKPGPIKSQPGYTFNGAKTPLENLIPLMAVCRAWRVRIEHTASLWRYLHSHDPLPRTQRAIYMSKTAPLRIICQNHVILDRVPAFMAMVAPLVGRWRVAVFWGESKSLFSSQYEHQEAPLLESLVVYGPKSDQPVIPFRSATLPRLKHVYVNGPALPWTSNLFSGLNYLNIRTGKHNHTSIHDLTQLLANNPLLTTLHVTLGEAMANDVGSDAYPIFHLPHLRTVRLEGPGAPIHFILRHIVAPQCWWFVCCIHMEYREGTLEHLVPFFRSTTSFANSLLSPISISITLNMGFLFLQVSEQQPLFRTSVFELSLNSNGVDQRQFLMAIVTKLLPFAHSPLTTTISLMAGFPLAEKQQLSEFLQKLPPAAIPHLNGYDETVLFDLLMENHEESHGDRPLLPGMEEMIVEQLRCGGDKLAELLERRLGRGTDGQRAPGKPFTLTIIKSVSETMKEDLWRKIVRLLGPDNVIEQHNVAVYERLLAANMDPQYLRI